jgi:ribosome-binding protein aMBF1 (putative translation factor)
MKHTLNSTAILEYVIEAIQKYAAETTSIEISPTLDGLARASARLAEQTVSGAIEVAVSKVAVRHLNNAIAILTKSSRSPTLHRAPADLGQVAQDLKNFGARIKAAREVKGWSQEQLGATLGVTRATVCQWELGQTVPRRGKWERLAELLPAQSSSAVNGSGQHDGAAAHP